jgi:hypothetical protein
MPDIEARNPLPPMSTLAEAFWTARLRQLRNAYLSRLQKNSLACLDLLVRLKAPSPSHGQIATPSHETLSRLPRSDPDENVLIAVRARLHLLLKCERVGYCHAVMEQRFRAARELAEAVAAYGGRHAANNG